MAQPLANKLSRREKQIMDVLFQRGGATVAEVLERLPDPPSYSAVRALLRTLEEKGHVRHFEDGPRYVYEPVEARDAVRESALSHLVKTFFDGSTEAAVAALLGGAERKLTGEELARIAQLVEQAKREGR